MKTEVGGQLFARLVKNEVRVIRATGPNSTDKRGWAWFNPDRKHQNAEIKGLFNEGLHFVGDWHTHPEREPNPSSLDLASMEDCFKKSRHQLKAFVMVIVGRQEFPKGIWVSLHGPAKWERLAVVVENMGMKNHLPVAGDRNSGQKGAKAWMSEAVAQFGRAVVLAAVPAWMRFNRAAFLTFYGRA